MEEKLAKKYIELIKVKASPNTIDEKIQPKFWDAVLLLLKDYNADISSLINENSKYSDYCVILANITSRFGVNYYSDYNAKTVKELVYKIVDEIKSLDSMSEEDIKFMIMENNFLLKKLIRSFDGTIF